VKTEPVVWNVAVAYNSIAYQTRDISAKFYQLLSSVHLFKCYQIKTQGFTNYAPQCDDVTLMQKLHGKGS